MNDFHADIRYSAIHKEFWLFAYFKMFNGITEVEDKTADMDYQKVGIDTIVRLKNGKFFFIDEKIRRKNYGDFLVEIVSNDIKNTPGWVRKSLIIDFIAYAIEETKEIYFIPFLELQKLYEQKEAEWKQKYEHKYADNFHYRTESLAIPFFELASINITKVNLSEAR